MRRNGTLLFNITRLTLLSVMTGCPNGSKMTSIQMINRTETGRERGREGGKEMEREGERWRESDGGKEMERGEREILQLVYLIYENIGRYSKAGRYTVFYYMSDRFGFLIYIL